jgi:hypothetical protein
MKVSIDQAITNVNECMSSVFTKEDVVNLLRNLEVKSNKLSKSELVDFVKSYVETQVEQLDAGDILDFDTTQFELNGNEIFLENVDVDTRELTRNILGEIDKSVDTFLNLLES